MSDILGIRPLLCTKGVHTPAHPREPLSGIKLRSTRGQSDLGGALDVAFAFFIAEHHITKNDVLAVVRLFLGYDTTTGQRRIVGYRSTEVGGELFQRASGEKFS